jgi:poly(glycerol-phosphate) alpha-glucosyltransferase
MLFFLNDGIQENKSGIEHAQIQRLNLFNHFKQPAMIVTRQYSNELHQVTKHAGIADEDFVNLFDYFQNARIVKPKDVTIKDVQIDADWQRKSDGNNYVYTRNGHQILYVRRRNDAKKHIINLQYFDHFGKLLNVKWYDIRGFISVEQVYDWQGNIATENYFQPNGKLALQLAHLKDKRGQEVKTYHLFDYHGQDYQFTGLDELSAFFLDQLVTDKEICGDGPVGIIVDRVYENGWSVLHMKNRVARYMQLHNDHVNHNEDMLHSTLNYNYEWGLRHIKDWDGVIALTPQQQDDVRDRFGKYGTPIFRVPSAIVSNETINAEHVPFEKRKLHHVVTVARLSPEKQQEHIIAAWPQILKAVPDATLDLWGYANDNYDEKLKKQVKDLGLEKSVHFRGYTTNVGQVDDEAQLMVLPTRVEGLSIALVEAGAHGLPAIANDVKYGPSDVIIDGQDGLLTQNGDIDGLAKAVISLLTDQKRLAQMSQNAYKDSYRYSEPSVMKLWQKIIDDMNEKEANK